MPRCTKWHRTPGWTATQIRKKALSWPLSNAKRLLNAVGCEAVDYAPETAMFYDVMDADITQQRRPAIVQKADGIVQQRGLYLRKG